MSTVIKAPTFPESVSEGTIASWYKKPGESVSRDELLVDIETDKVVLEVTAPTDGVLADVVKQEGETVMSEEVIASIDTGAAQKTSAKSGIDEASNVAVMKQRGPKANETEQDTSSKTVNAEELLSPAVRKLVQEHSINPDEINASGKGGRITKADVLAFLDTKKSEEKEEKSSEVKSAESPPLKTVSPVVMNELPEIGTEKRIEKRVPMTRLRARIAERLVQAQQSAAMLTTFNEVNMQPIMTLRKKYRDEFEKTHKVRLGFMSFFVKAATEALKRFPVVNASIDGNEIVYHGFYDIGVAVSTERGLVVPILRDTDQKSLAEIESNIVGYSDKARDNKLTIEDIQGGTFTISNGGVFGSLMSTPILNPPQSAILGMHKIQERPMVIDGQIVIQPMMYLALSYDHRLIDGREAVQFLIAIKELVEDPMKLLLDI